MEGNLTDQIVLHIFTNVGVVTPMKISLKNKVYLLNQTLDLEDDKKLQLWGAEVDIGGSKLRMLMTDLTENPKEKEFALVVKLENCPSYGCYLLLEDTITNKNHPRDGKVFFSLGEKHWLETNTFIQATFLAGMEQLKDVLSNWNKVEIEDDLVEDMKLLVNTIFDLEDEE